MEKVKDINPQIEEKAVSNTLSEKEGTHKPIKKIVRVQFDIEYGGSVGKLMDSKSETMPDMHMTVKQLLENHSRGRESGKLEIRQPLFFETEIPTLNDITDVDEFKESLERRLEDVNEFIKNEQEVKKAEERRKAAATKEATEKAEQNQNQKPE